MIIHAISALLNFVVIMNEVELQQYFDDFFEEVFTEIESKVNCLSI